MKFAKDKITLLNCDCMDYMKDIPDNHFDLAIVDPPYGIKETGTGRNCYDKRRPHIKQIRPEKYKKKDWDNNVPTKEYFNELFRISKHQIIWGANYMVNHLSPSMGWIFWDKKTEAQDFSDGELAYTTFNRGLKKVTMHKFIGTNGGKNCIHPTQKPVKLYKWLLKNYAEPNFKIIDTHLGSGSSAIAAYYFGCEFIGCEIDKEYYDSAVKRFDNETKQMTLAL